MSDAVRVVREDRNAWGARWHRARPTLPEASHPAARIPRPPPRAVRAPAGETCLHARDLSCPCDAGRAPLEMDAPRSEEHTSELQSPCNLVCRLLLEKKKQEDDS